MRDEQYLERVVQLEAALLKVNEVIDHQANPYVHPLTCGVDSNHEPLLPRWKPETSRLVLRCPTCQWEQAQIPAVLMPDATPFALGLTRPPEAHEIDDASGDVGC